MKHSLSYYVVLLILKIKGIKKVFNKTHIDYLQLRTKDIRNPKGSFYRKNTLRKFCVLDSQITEIGLNSNSPHLLLFFHGGAFISGPAKHHWDVLKKIAKSTNFKIWLCDYPKAPENNIVKISRNIDAIYGFALKNYVASKIAILGDSVGGTLSAALTQRLIATNIDTPSKIILVSPVMDASMSNKQIKELESLDPFLSFKGVLSAKKLCAQDIDLKHPIISPLFGSFEGFPKTLVFLAHRDIMFPDAKIAVEKMKKEKVDVQVINGIDMPHIWPLLPIMKESKESLTLLIEFLK